jgi:hypothetical protein
MKTYKVTFIGREKGAIGIFYQITATVKGEDEKQALLNLYDNYDHVSSPNFKDIIELKEEN